MEWINTFRLHLQREVEVAKTEAEALEREFNRIRSESGRADRKRDRLIELLVSLDRVDPTIPENEVPW